MFFGILVILLCEVFRVGERWNFVGKLVLDSFD